MSEKTKKQFIIASLVGVGAIILIAKYRKTIFKKIKNFIGIYEIPEKEIVIVNDGKQCVDFINRIKLHCEKYNVLGFDAEWVNVNGNRKPVALLQLCTSEGLCGLIRLNKLDRIPKELRDILEDSTIVKVGVAPINDANLLLNDYSIRVSATYDLRFLAYKLNVKPASLAKLSKEVLDIDLDKDWRTRCSDWEVNQLSEQQIEYAAKDAQCGIEIFKILYSRTKRNTSMQEILKYCEDFIDTHFKYKHTQNGGLNNKKGNNNRVDKQNIRSYCTRSKPLYDNSYLQAPDGESLCTIEKKKAEWYISKGLGEKIQDEPFIVRLNFEPAGRAQGDVGKYYLSPKENQCVVCGKTENLFRKNVVPKEYRKHFPIVLKDHTSHDILLLCVLCHQQSNIVDHKLRQELEILCNAPLKNSMSKEMKMLANQEADIQKKARALYNNSEKIPPERKMELKNKLAEYYPDKELTMEFLREIMDQPPKQKENEEDIYHKHGEIVVEYFKKNGGLIVLERKWRQHFLDAMQPNFLPALWSIDHNAGRLEIRATEGRVEAEDLKIAGLDVNLLKSMAATSNVTQKDGLKLNSTSDPKSNDTNVSFSDTEFKSFTEQNTSKGQSNDDTMREDYLSDSTLASHYETIRSDSSTLDYSDYKSFDKSNSVEHHKYDSDDTDSTLSQPSSSDAEEDLASAEDDTKKLNKVTKT